MVKQTMKICSVCFKNKPTEEYDCAHKKKKTIRSDCKSCRSLRNKIKYYINKKNGFKGEDWLPIYNKYPYEISSIGRIRNVLNNKIIRCYRGYVNLSDGSTRKKYKVEDLIKPYSLMSPYWKVTKKREMKPVGEKQYDSIMNQIKQTKWYEENYGFAD